MRIRVDGIIQEKKQEDKRNYTYGIYAMILSKLRNGTAKKYHTKNKEMRLFTFTNVYIYPPKENVQNAHLYIAGEDSIINQFIQGITKNPSMSVDDMIIDAKSISILPELPQREKYLFKTKVIINIPLNNKTVLLEDIPLVEKRLRANAIRKANLLGKHGDIKLKIINPEKCVEKYRKGHIFSWKCFLEVTGDYDVINTIYQCGAGENTASGHGFLWEISNA